MLTTLEGWVGIVAAVVAALAWLFRLEGRISAHEQVCAQRQLQLTERHDATTRQLSHLAVAVSEVNAKLDRVIEAR
jgi:hypothetical protein